MLQLPQNPNLRQLAHEGASVFRAA
jgi:hypothetical protein